MEIKTCEQYVIDKLNDAEMKNSHLEATLKILETQAEYYKTEYEKLCDTLKSLVSEMGDDSVIGFELTMKKWNEDRFNYLSKVLGLDKEKDDAENLKVEEVK